MKIDRLLLPIVGIGMCSVALANSPFDGTWKLNVEKSRLMANTLSWEDAGNGEVRFSNPNSSYTYKPDGRFFTTPMGDQQSVEKVSDSLYRLTTKRPGVGVIDETFRLSSDGNTLYLDGKTTRTSGQSSEIHNTYVRKSGTTGLIGNWESTVKFKVSPQTLTIQTLSNNDFTLTFSPDKSTVHGKWDGADYAFNGPAVPAGGTMAFSRTGADAFKIVHKVNAKTVEILQFRLASGGRSMTMDGTNIKGQKLIEDVWDQ